MARYLVGRCSDGSGFGLGFPFFPHVLLAGVTGAGKSTLLHGICAAVAGRDDLAIVGVDLKRLELAIAEPRLSVLARTAAEADLLLADVLELVEYRQAVLEFAGVQRWSGERGPFVLVLVDEFARLAGVDAERLVAAARSVEADSKLVRQAKEALRVRLALLASIAALARAVGVWLIGATQYPTADVIDNQIRTQFECRIMLRVASREQPAVILGESHPQITPESIPASQRGGFWCVGHPEHVRPVRGRAFFVEVAQLAERYESAAHLRVDPVDLFAPSRGFLADRSSPLKKG